MNENLTSQLFVGVSKKTLAFPDGFFPHKGFRGRYFTGIHDDLNVRAAYIGTDSNQILLVSLELGDIGSQWLEEIGAAVGLPAENIFLTVTHTHSAPHIHSTWHEDVIDIEMGEKFADMCRKTVIEAAREAMKNIRPAAMQFDTGWCDINSSRDLYYKGRYIIASNPAGKSDKTVAVTKFTDSETGKTILLLVNYAIHSLVCFYQTWDYTDSMLISSDLSGEAMRYVEERLEDGAVSMFLLGAAGDQQPRYIANHRSYEKDGTVGWHYEGREAAFAMCRVQAEPLAMEVLRLVDTMNEGTGNSKISVLHFDVTSMGKIEGMRVEVKEGEEHNDGTSYSSQYKEVSVNDFHYTPTEPITMKLGMFRIGDITFITVPAEIVCHIGEMMRIAAVNKLGGSAVVITQCNGAYSYITDDDGYQKMTFEALSSHFMPGIAQELENGTGKASEIIAAM